MGNPEGKELQKVAEMGWKDFEERLQHPKTRALEPGAPNEEAMRTYFGDEEFEDLQRLAARARTRAPEEKLGNIIFLPGIMGSNLATVDQEGDEDLVWVNIFRLAFGSLDRLKLLQAKDAAYTVKATSIDKRTYARAILTLSENWNVQPFPYDWRLNIDESSKALAELIQKRFRGKPVHLVAHSMGGLVSRNFIRLNKHLWENMRDEDGGCRGGRLVMLGTPNYGSYAIPQVLTGTEKLVNWLSMLDLSHNLDEVLDVIGTFTGMYQMLPAPSKIPDSVQSIYRGAAWGQFPVIAENLKAAAKFHQNLEERETIDPKRMAYIAGCNQQTLCGLEIRAPGEFQYTTTCDGDGRVPFALGKLAGVPTYYVEECHGSLPRNELVIKAVEELLERGTTSILATRQLPSRAILPEGATWHRSPGEYRTSAKLEQIALRVREGKATPEEINAAEETLMGAVMGEPQPSEQLHKVEIRKPGDDGAVRPTSLSIEVVRGDVRQVEAPVVVVGHYKGVAPVKAEKSLDEVLDGWITMAGKHSMIGAELGQLFFIPANWKGVVHEGLASDAVLLAGMGEEGRFNRHDLRYLMLNVASAISALKVSALATVLIGSGKGNLKEDVALRSMIFGVCDAIKLFPDDSKLSKLILIENNEERARCLHKLLDRVKKEESAAEIRIEVLPIREMPELPDREEDEPRDPCQGGFVQGLGTRITVERDGDTFRFSALTDDAVIPVRSVEVQDFFPAEISQRLMTSGDKEEQRTFGCLLNTALFPQEFQQLFRTDDPLTLILDRNTASIPWEMSCFDGPSGPAFLGTDLCLARQFRTLLSPAPGITPKLNKSLKVLVIADPAPEPEYQLRGALREGREVVKILNLIKYKCNLDIEVIDRIGASECDTLESLSLILDGEFDVIHFAGHGFFNEEKPSRGGWVFGKNRVVSATEIFRTRKAPRLVFANACFSAVVNQGKPLGPEEMNRQLAGIAEAFFERGVRNYLGTGWPVQDDLAVKFATDFYARAITGYGIDDWKKGRTPCPEKGPLPSHDGICPDTLGEAIRKARAIIAAQGGSTWGAYHHYGKATTQLMI